MNRIGRPGRYALIACGLLAAGGAWDRPAPSAPQEAWDAVYIDDNKVGYIHTRVEAVQDKAGRALRRVQVQTVLNFRRLSDKTSIQMRFGTIETPEGAVLRLDSRTLASQDEIRTHGDVVDGRMALKLVAGGRTQQVVLAWGPDVRGPYGPELSLAREPIKPGESRTIKTFIPDLNVIGLTRLTAKGPEEILLGGGVRRALLRVDSTVSHEDGRPLPGMNSTYWVDAGGQILKSATDVFGGMVTYRTTREAATASTADRFDISRSLIVPVTRKIPAPESTRAVVYRVRLQDEDPAAVFPSDRRQRVRPAPGTHTAVLEVQTAGKDAGAAGPERVADEFLRPSPMINSADPAIVDLARKAVGRATDPWAQAVAIQEWVAANLRNKNFETSFAPASEVAQNLTGDCSEHSVLTAALCRAAGIPARVVVGLVYAETLGGFGFHMWNEAYVNRRWVALDAAFRQADVDAVHIKLSDTSLDGVSPFETFLSVVRVADKLSLEPLEIR
jgi:transglutaminase-like putative cysteine protease